MIRLIIFIYAIININEKFKTHLFDQRFHHFAQLVGFLLGILQ